MQITFHKQIDNSETKHLTLIYFNSKTQVVVNDSDIDSSLKTSYQTILLKTQKWLGENSGWINESTYGDYIEISIHNLLAGSCNIKLPEEFFKFKKRFNQHSK